MVAAWQSPGDDASARQEQATYGVRFGSCSYPGADQGSDSSVFWWSSVASGVVRMAVRFRDGALGAVDTEFKKAAGRRLIALRIVQTFSSALWG